MRQNGGLNRREFLGLCAAGALGVGALAACSGSPSTGKTPTRTATSAPRQPSEADWATLAGSLQGTLVRLGNAQYDAAKLLFNTRFDALLPMAIAYCAAAADVQQCLAFARRFALPIAPRSGGHSYGGYSSSSGIVLDVTRINGISVNTGDNTTTIGGGALLIDVYDKLANYGLVLPAGSCPTVGIAGLALGGGVGVLVRKFGLTSDNMLAAQIVTADGSLLTCDATTNADLFWALRGGGGGNFGVVTSFTFQAFPVATLTVFTYNWPWSAAPAMFDAWQHWMQHMPDELWSNCLLLVNDDKAGQPIARVNGVYVGDVGPVPALLQQLVSAIGVAPSSSVIAPNNILDTMLIEAGCFQKTVAECHQPGQNPQGQVQRDTSYAKADYFTSMLPPAAISGLVKAITQRQASPQFAGAGFGFDATGGAINRVAADATAFVHRDTLFSAQYSANWQPTDPSSLVDANLAWVKSVWQTMRPYASGQAYQNYIDPYLPNWPQAYYGANLPRLMSVKRAYDPANIFSFAQSIPPA